MRIGIVTPMEEEKILLTQNLSDTNEKRMHGILVTVGHYQGHEIFLVEAGIGKVQSAMATSLLIDHFEIDLIINTGSAGALAAELTVGDIVIGTELRYHDVDVTAFGYEYGQMAQQPVAFYSDEQLVKTMTQVVPAIKQGLIVSGDQFVSGAQRETIKQHFPTALMAEMESTAIAQVATTMGKPFLIIRSVSDNADGTANVDFDDFVKVAGKASAKLALALIEKMGD